GAFDNLTAGTVIAIPLLNVYGFINYSRDLPDGKDINRSFPGSLKGSLASRVAKTLTQHILPLVDLGVDFHTGGKSIHNVPQLRIDPTMEEALPLAQKFGARLIIKSSLIPRSLRKECNRRKIPMLVFEGGESLRLDEESIAEGRAGILNLLFAYGMIEGHEPIPFENKIIVDNHWIRASFAGVFESYKKPNDFVERGDLLGQISTPYDKTVKKVKARKKGVIFGINNNPVVNQGDALYHIGF
ncbi:MAG: succinylglutamate desuccinylase/aspartoacylase family protein, partial [Flavobacteriales bacterium]